jgi:hypothetical protein
VTVKEAEDAGNEEKKKQMTQVSLLQHICLLGKKPNKQHVVAPEAALTAVAMVQPPNNNKKKKKKSLDICEGVHTNVLSVLHYFFQ